MIDRKLSGDTPRIVLPAGAIDTQTHVYVDGFPAVDGGPGLPPAPLPTADMYRQVMDWLGIDRVVVTQGNAHQADNACLLAALAELGDIARGVAVIRGDETDAEMQRLDDGGIVGARIMDLPGGAVGLKSLTSVDDRANAVGWAMAVQFDGTHLPELEPQLMGIKSRWVLDHHAKIFGGATQQHIDVIKRLIDTGNVWFKFAGCYESSNSGGPEFTDVADVARQIVRHAPERVLWGTNWPHNLAKTTAEYPDDGALIDTVLGWVPADVLEQVLVYNPEDFFGFGRWA